MNALSWLIYGAEIGPKIGNVAGSIAIVLTVVGAFGCIPILAVVLDYGDGLPSFVKPLYKRLAIIVIICTIIFGLAPSSQTILLIAASEIGERTIQSQQFSRVEERIATTVVDPSIELLTTWIRTQTEELKARSQAANHGSQAK
jgi:hypothetical protein